MGETSLSSARKRYLGGTQTWCGLSGLSKVFSKSTSLKVN